MIILGVPPTDKLNDYYMADGDTIWELVRAGFHAVYMDNDVQYFRLNNKLRKYLKKLQLM